MIACGTSLATLSMGSWSLWHLWDSTCFSLLSYGFILQAVFHIPSWEARGKALSTCDSHLCVICLFYSPVVFSVLAQVLGYHIAPHLQIITDSLYFLVPPMANPWFIKYGSNICRSECWGSFSVRDRWQFWWKKTWRCGIGSHVSLVVEFFPCLRLPGERINLYKRGTWYQSMFFPLLCSCKIIRKRILPICLCM
jgi:hypothetical protein